MKTKNFFAGHRSGGRAERFKKMENNSFKNLFGKKTMIFIILLTLFLGFTTNASAENAGFYEVYMTYSYSGENSNYTYKKGDNGNSTISLGTLSADFNITSLYLKFYYNNNDWGRYGNICGGLMGYNIGAGDKEYQPSWSWSEDKGFWDNFHHKEISSTATFTVAKWNGPSGNYTFSHWFKGWGNENGKDDCPNNWYINNNNQNYKFTYTIAPPAVTNFAVSATNGALSGSGTESNPYLVKYGTTLTLSASSNKAHDDGNSHRNYSFASGSYSTTNTYTSGSLTASGLITVKACCINTSDSNLKGAESSTDVYYTVVYTDLQIADAGCTMQSASTLSAPKVAKGSSVTITKGTPATGYEFKDITVTSGGTIDGLTWTPSDNSQKATVNWKETLHSVAVVCKDEANTQIGTGSAVEGVGIVTSQSVTAPDIAGYTFSTWVLTEGVTSSSTLTNKTISINATADGKTITAKYTKDASFSLQVAKGTHVTTVSGDQATIELGHSYAISATGFDNGYEFNNWTASPEENAVFESSTSASTNVTVNNGSVIVTANAKATTYTIEYVLPEGVTTTNPTSYTIESAEITLSNPSNRIGYNFAGWTCDDNPITQIAHGSTGNKTITATWTAIPYNITYNETHDVAHSNPATYTIEDEIIFSAPTERTGYTFTAWNPAKIDRGSTGDKSTSAQWTAKTYTISFSQEGGTGGQTGTVTATYNQAMPGNVTCPTRVGYKFNGYYSATSGGTQYYNASGTSAHKWDIDQENPTLYAQWTQLHVYVQGRMHVANKKRSAGGDITWTNSFKGGTQTETDHQWAEACRAIEMQLVTENDRTYYKLVTNATLSDLSTKFSGGDNLWQYFYLRSTSVTTSGGTWDGSTYKQVVDGSAFTLADRGEEHARTWSAEGTNQPCFSSDDRSGYVIIYFDETKVWYELDEFPTYDVEFSNGGGGGTVTPSGTKKTGEVSWEVTVNPNEGYSFAGWTLTGGAKAKENDEELKTFYTIHVTATGDGKAIANFKIKPKLYFQTNDAFSNKAKVYAYFYKNEYFLENTESGGTGSKKDWGCISGPHEMQPLGHDNIYYMYYDIEYLRSQGMDSHIAFTKDSKDNADRFYETNVVYRGDFYPCDQPLFVVTDYDKTYNKSGYYKGYWSKMDGDDAEDYLMMASENWKTNENMRFKKDNNGNWIVIKNYSGFASNYHDEFRIWRNCDGNWYGCGQTDSHNQNITSDISGWKLYTGTSNIDITPWKEGDYEFKWNPNSQELSVTYLGDITVANFPEEVSTFKDRQHKIKPDVTLRNGTTVNDVTITVTHVSGSNNIATYEQNGTNLVITGNAIGSETVTVRYQNNKQDPYIVERTLKVNVATPIVIQATLDGKSATEDDDYWSKTGLVHIHFWGSDAAKTQDMDMSYNKDTKVFSVTAPKIDDFEFMFWYGEDINQSASEAWRKTQDIDDCTTNTCYSISYGTSKTETRTATAKENLCTADEYYVEITMKNGNTYKSNTIDDLNDTVSFFAPKDNDATYMGGTVRIVHNGEVSNPLTGFSQAGVYVAKLASATAFAKNSIELYTGNYYIRTDGAGGMWNDYKTNDDNIMISFTPRAEKGETFSYYWVKNVAKTDTGTDGKVNVKADVANDYNDNLAGMIENDKFTDGGGYVYESTNGANVRFSYEPTTNEFKRAILGGSGNNNFLNVYSKTNNLYADNGHTKQLSESADLNDSKFSDLSDWVYEKQVYVTADGSHAVNVILKSVFNGQTTHLLGYTKNEKGEDTDVPNELEVMGSQSTGDFALRITYDFKKNRLIASWEPGQREISENMIIDSDVLFVQQEAADGTIDNTDVAQITYTQGGIEAEAKLTSLKNMIYVLEVTDKVIDNTDADNQLYWICLPFDCRISDIYGVEGYVKLDAGGRAISGTWGIQRYDGTTRAAHGWFEDDNPEGFWKWMTRDEELKAGTGYVVVFDKTGASSWPSIDVEVACNSGTDCVEGKKTVKKRSKRLYFPSIGSKFEICYSGSSANVVEYADEPCNVTKPHDRSQYDGNWKVIGPVSYNNIGVDQGATKNLTYYYTYSQDNALAGSAHYTGCAVGPETELKSFHGYMTQFGGDLTWKPFTKSEDVTTPIVQAPRYMESLDFRGGLLTIELNNAQGTQLDRTFVNLHKNGTLGFDQNMELTKISENCAQIASVNEDVLYAGSTLPLDIELVPLNVKVVANGTYDIALAQSLEGLEVRLYDAFEQTTTPLDLMSATVTLDKGEYKDRFFLQFVQKSPLTPTNFNGAIEQFNLPTDKTQKLLINDNIYLINGGRIYNVLGARP